MTGGMMHHAYWRRLGERAARTPYRGFRLAAAICLATAVGILPARGDESDESPVVIVSGVDTSLSSFTVSPPFINLFVSLNDGSNAVAVAVTLIGQGSSPIDYELNWLSRPWFSINKNNGTIGVNSTDTFTITFYPTQVPPGRYTADIEVKNLTNGAGTTTLPLTLLVSGFASGAVTLVPDTDIQLRGPQGRLPVIAPQGATLRNGSDRFVFWETTIDQPWVSVSPTGGELAPAGEAQGLDEQTLDIRPNIAVNNLTAGAYIATASFQNITTSAPIATRVVQVVVDPLLKITASAPNATVQVYPTELQQLDGNTGPLVYELGDVVSLTAITPDGYQFVAWYFDGEDGETDSTEENPAVITMNRSRTATALMQPLARELTLSTSGDGTGTVKTSPSGQVVDNPLVSHYPNATVVEILAEPDAGAQFLGWAGNVPAGEEQSNPLTVVMDRDRVITAKFGAGVTLDVTSSDGGSVSVDPQQSFYVEGSQVTLTPVPAEGFVFSGWSGDASGSANPLTITLSGATSISASFVEEGSVGSSGFALDVEVVGNGEVSPASGMFDAGARVLLVATPATGARFVSWEGDASGADLTAEVVMDSNRTVRAIFEADTGRPVTGVGCGAMGLLTIPVTLLGFALLRASAGTSRRPQEGVIEVRRAQPQGSNSVQQ